MPTAPLNQPKRPNERTPDPVLERELFLSDWDLRFERTMVIPQADAKPGQQLY